MVRDQASGGPDRRAATWRRTRERVSLFVSSRVYVPRIMEVVRKRAFEEPIKASRKRGSTLVRWGTEKVGKADLVIATNSCWYGGNKELTW